MAAGQRSDTAASPARVAAVDGLRGLLAWVVVAWHALKPFGLAWLLEAANLAVVLFFVISGYALTRAWDGRFGVFAVRRVSRLWPVFALCLGAGYLVAGVHPVWSEFLWFPYIGPNDRPAIDPPVWSLFLEAWAIPFMPLIVWAGGGVRTLALACMLTNVLVLIVLHDGRLMMLPLFFVGSYLSQFEIRNRLLESPLPQWLGRVSYSLYLSHFMVIALALRVLGPWGGVAAVPAAFAVGWLVWRLVERPSILVSRRLGAQAGELFDGLGRRLRAGFA